MGSEMCIRDRDTAAPIVRGSVGGNDGVAYREVAAEVECERAAGAVSYTHLTLADERSSVDLGGRRIIKKKTGAGLRWGHLRYVGATSAERVVIARSFCSRAYK